MAKARCVDSGRYRSSRYFAAGDRIILQTNDNQDPSEADGFDPQRAITQSAAITVASGDIIRMYSVPGSRIFSSDGRSFVLHQADGFLASTSAKSSLEDSKIRISAVCIDN
jgi:hypothetical protein